MWIDYEFQLNFNDKYSPRVAVLRQYDRFLGRFIIRPTINGAAINLTALQARLVAKKPDDTQCLLSGKIENGKLVFNLEDQVAAAVGMVQFEVILSENTTDGRQTSAMFTAEVVPGVFDESALESQDSYPALLDALDAAEEVRRTPQAINMGGTGATTAEEALVNLGAQPLAEDSGWIPLRLNDGVSAGSYGGRSVPSYRKIGNRVFMEGSVVVTPGSSSVTIATLPAGYRPRVVIHKLTEVAGKRIGRIMVGAGGTVNVEWVLNVTDGSSVMEGAWVAVKMDFFID